MHKITGPTFSKSLEFSFSMATHIGSHHGSGGPRHARWQRLWTNVPRNVASHLLRMILGLSSGLVVSTHLKHVIVKMGSSSPSRGEHKKCLKPPPSHCFMDMLTQAISTNSQYIAEQSLRFKIIETIYIVSSDFVIGLLRGHTFLFHQTSWWRWFGFEILRNPTIAAHRTFACGIFTWLSWHSNSSQLGRIISNGSKHKLQPTGGII